MNKWGIIFCLYNCEPTLEKCLEPWKQVKNENLVYSCVSAPFKGYEDFNPPKDNTVELVRAANIMDSHFVSETHLAETEARGQCLEYLKKENCEILFFVDGDEIFTIDEINKIIEYVENNPQILWFKLCLKNYIFDHSTYLEDPFVVPRIYRVNSPPFKLGNFYQDNDVGYIFNNQEFPNTVVKNKVIPQSLVWPRHITWPNNENSRLKIEYQQKRWGLCSYEWKDGNLQFSENYYKNKPKPKVIKEV